MASLLVTLPACGTIDREVRGGKTIKQSAEKRSSIMDDVCKFQRRDSKFATASIMLGNNNVVNGDITAIARVNYETVWSSIATPLVDRVTEESIGPGFCSKTLINMYGQPYTYATNYPDCPINQTYDVNDVYGLGRGETRRDSETLALENCYRSVRRLTATYEDLEYHDDKLECVIAVTNACER